MSSKEKEVVTMIEYVESVLRKINTLVYGLSHAKATDDELFEAIIGLIENDKILTALRVTTRNTIESCAKTLLMRSHRLN